MDAARAVEAKMRLAKTDIERKEGKRPSSHKAGAGATMNSDLCHKLWNIISLPFFHGSACLFPTRFTTKQRTSHTKTSASHQFQKNGSSSILGTCSKISVNGPYTSCCAASPLPAASSHGMHTSLFLFDINLAPGHTYSSKSLLILAGDKKVRKLELDSTAAGRALNIGDEQINPLPCMSLRTLFVFFSTKKVKRVSGKTCWSFLTFSIISTRKISAVKNAGEGGLPANR